MPLLGTHRRRPVSAADRLEVVGAPPRPRVSLTVGSVPVDSLSVLFIKPGSSRRANIRER
jgi:hypothetical protein